MSESVSFWKALGESLCQVVAPTKSNTEIELRQQAREAAAGDDVAAALEKLAERNREKVAQGLELLQALRTGKIQRNSNNEQQQQEQQQQTNHEGQPPKEQH